MEIGACGQRPGGECGGYSRGRRQCLDLMGCVSSGSRSSGWEAQHKGSEMGAGDQA